MPENERSDVAIIGGGPAGLAAAAAAREAGASVLVLEREAVPGGILGQCIHNGFGLHRFGEELTGPEYAARSLALAEGPGVEIRCDATVLALAAQAGGCTVTAADPRRGLCRIRAGAVVLAMGCRERPRGALNIPGSRPAGIYSAGTAQRYINLEGRLPGREVVILGSGDIGLIMARRLTWEGAHVQAVAELMPYPGGLKRNIVQCLQDNGIPLLLSHTVVGIRGRERLTGVTLAAVDAQRRPIPGTERDYACDTLLLSVGLLPENELSRAAGAALHPVTGGPVVDESFETSLPGVFACGNVLHVHDLVDNVSEEAEAAGRSAAAHALGRLPASAGPAVAVQAGPGVRYALPMRLCPARMPGTLPLRLRVDGIYRDRALTVRLGGRELFRRRRRVLAPGEMETVAVQRAWLADAAPGAVLTVALEEA